MVIAASAMDIAPGGPLAAFDFQLAYLERWLGFIGAGTIASLRVAPTYGAEADVQAVVEAACERARTMAPAFAQALASRA